MRPILAVVLFACVIAASCEKSGNEPATRAAAPDSPVKITQFYSAKPVHKGEPATICYGVENAKKVRLDPPVAQISPSLSRCFEFAPTGPVNLTLTAEGGSGNTATQTIAVKIGAAPPEIYDFSVNATTIRRGQQVSVCFKAHNAVSVSGGPGKFFLKRKASADCLMDAPVKTTRYEITVTGASGETDSRDVTVKVQ